MTVQGPPLMIQKAFQSCSVGVTVSDDAPPADGETEKLKPSKEKKTWTRTISETLPPKLPRRKDVIHMILLYGYNSLVFYFGKIMHKIQCFHAVNFLGDAVSNCIFLRCTN